MKVLIVDDNEQNLYLLRALLEGNGCTVDCAHHGAEALTKARQSPPELVVADLLMPVMDGYTLLRHWKADERLKAIPFVVYTATYTEPKDERLALDLGADAFIVKPAEPEEFMVRIRRVPSAAHAADGTATRVPQGTETDLLREYGLVVVRKLEQKAAQLEEANRALKEDVARRQEAEAQAKRLLVEAERAHAASLTALQDQRKAEAALRENEERLRLALSAANQGLFDLNVQTGETIVSPEYARMLGYEPDEFHETNAAWRDRLHPSDREAACRAYEEYINGQRQTYRIECRQRTKSGDWKWILSVGRVVARDGEGNPLRMLGTHTDITERKQAEEALQESERRLKETQRMAQLGHWRWDMKSGRVEWSEEVFSIFRLDPNEFTPSIESILAMSPWPEDHARDKELIRKALESHERGTYDQRFLRPDGSIGYYHSTFQGVYDSQDNLVEIVGTILDITERKSAEQRVADALNFNRTIIESSPFGIVVYQASGQATFANPSIAQILGATPEQVLAQNFRQLESWQRSGLLEAAEQALVTRTEQQLEVRHESAFGKQVDLACRLVPFTYADQPHLLLLAVDVTEQRLMQAKLLRAQRVESIGSLASGIAHDLNNILTPIVMCAPLLRLEDSPVGRCEMAHTIETSAHRAVGIVKQLLSFARGKEGRKAVLQARHLIRDMAKIARETFPRNIQVEVLCAADLWPVVADATQLHQVILNLCVNARDAMPTGGKLTLRAENVTFDEQSIGKRKEASPGPYIRIQVEDTGTGIPDALRDRIFESFFTTKGEGEGTGLGLTTVQGIVQDHKGFITFTTATGKGTTFIVHLPAVPAATSSGAEVQNRDAIPRGRSELILVVDDETAIRETTRRSLERYGYRVLQAHDGIEALAHYAAHRQEVRAVVTDFMMPLMDGVTLCRSLRALSPELPLIVSSGGLFGKSGSKALEAFEELGLRHILQKPHTADLLLQALDQVLHPPTSTATSTPAP